MIESCTWNSDTADINWKMKYIGKNLQRTRAAKVETLKLYIAEFLKNLHN